MIELAMKMLKRGPGIVLAALLLILLVPASAVGQEVPPLPASYWGTLRIRSQVDGQLVDAPVGTVVTAWVGGKERGKIVTTEPGKYGGPAPYPNLVVQGDILQGSLVLFYVNGFKADQTALYDHPEEVNLTAFVPPTIPGDANGDGKVNILDMTRVARMILLLDPETPGADAKPDGFVNVLDMAKIARIILQLD